MDIGTIMGALATGAAAIQSTAAGMKDFKDTFLADKGASVEQKALLLQLYDHLIDAKQAQAEVEEMLRQFDHQQRERDEFAAQSARYSLQPAGRGTLLYTLKDDDPLQQPPHRICTGCHAKRIISILQPHTDRHNTLHCPSCRADYLSEDVRGGQAYTVAVRRGMWGGSELD